jgi:hypothetical protein
VAKGSKGEGRKGNGGTENEREIETKQKIMFKREHSRSPEEDKRR